MLYPCPHDGSAQLPGLTQCKQNTLFKHLIEVQHTKSNACRHPVYIDNGRGEFISITIHNISGKNIHVAKIVSYYAALSRDCEREKDVLVSVNHASEDSIDEVLRDLSYLQTANC